MNTEFLENQWIENENGEWWIDIENIIHIRCYLYGDHWNIQIYGQTVLSNSGYRTADEAKKTALGIVALKMITFLNSYPALQNS